MGLACVESRWYALTRFHFQSKELLAMSLLEEFGRKVEQQSTNQEVNALEMRVETLAAQVAALQSALQALSEKVDALSAGGDGSGS